MYRKRVDLCLELCRQGEKVLEVGFGSGLTFLSMADKYRQIYGLDMDSDIAHVTRYFKEKGLDVNLLNGNVLDMPYEDNTFDTVILISILEHLQPDVLNKAAGEIKRVLRTGGQVVIGVPVERPLMTLLFLMIGYNIRKYHFSTHQQVMDAMGSAMKEDRIEALQSIFGRLYLAGSFNKI
ncbi:MAG TPA: class I SAM-dependent methyltransferase [Syntrophales bacterium]|nr:class I SAM-dependent methyltransferase [Syntrophales bacterium]